MKAPKKVIEISEDLTQRIQALPKNNLRSLIAIAGPPGSGKSTISEALKNQLTAKGTEAAILPMDGFHLDNSILDQRGLRPRKGSPETFDLPGFTSLVQRLKVENELYGPSFDRTKDLSIGSSVYFDSTVSVIIVEGNYLHLDAAGWRELQPYWDLTINVVVEEAELRKRLRQRWLDLGLSETEADAKVDLNDMPNAKLIARNSLPASIDVTA